MHVQKHVHFSSNNYTYMLYMICVDETIRSCIFAILLSLFGYEMGVSLTKTTQVCKSFGCNFTIIFSFPKQSQISRSIFRMDLDF